MFNGFLFLLLALVPICLGVLLAVGCSALMDRHPSPLPWPLFLFLCLLGLAALSAVTALLLRAMLARSGWSDWGLSLMQTPAGPWYARLCLPSAILLGDYQYAWEITPARLCLLSLAPNVIFTLGYLAPHFIFRGICHVWTHSEN